MEDYYVVNNVFKGYPDEPDKVTIDESFKGCNQEVDYASVEEFIIQQLINCNEVKKFCHFIGYPDAAAMIINFIRHSHLDNSNDKSGIAYAKESYWVNLIAKDFGGSKSHDTIRRHNLVFKSREYEPIMGYMGEEYLNNY